MRQPKAVHPLGPKLSGLLRQALDKNNPMNDSLPQRHPGGQLGSPIHPSQVGWPEPAACPTSSQTLILQQTIVQGAVRLADLNFRPRNTQAASNPMPAIRQISGMAGRRKREFDGAPGISRR